MNLCQDTGISTCIAAVAVRVCPSTVAAAAEALEVSATRNEWQDFDTVTRTDRLTGDVKT